MKFLIDMNLSPLWIPFLAGEGFEAVHWSTVGEPGAADSEILDFAASGGGWIVFTHDLDFGMLLAALRTERPKCRSGSLPGRFAHRHWRFRASCNSHR
jgi:predicted nuclease of predicted toxin-antitoxin system